MESGPSGRMAVGMGPPPRAAISSRIKPTGSLVCSVRLRMPSTGDNSEYRTMRARSRHCKRVWTCHWSWRVTWVARIFEYSSSLLPGSERISANSPSKGSPLLQRLNARITPPRSTMRAAAEIPLTVW